MGAPWIMKGLVHLLVLWSHRSAAASLLRLEEKLNKDDFSLRYNNHPMLYFGADQVDHYRSFVHTSHQHITKELTSAVNLMMGDKNKFLPPLDYETFSSDWNEIYGNNLPALALYCLLYPDDVAAQNFTLTYMDRMANYSSWLIIGTPMDMLPVAHSLLGFSVAYDMIYSNLDFMRKVTYISSIIKATNQNFDSN